MLRSFVNCSAATPERCLRAGFAAMFLFSLAGAAVAQKLDTNEVVTIAIANEPPFTELKPDGTITGSGPDVDIAILKAAGFKQFKGEVMKYGSMIPALQASRVRMVSSGGLSIRPERCEQVIFSDPVTCGAEAFLVRGDLAGKFDSYTKAAQMNIKVGVFAGGSQEKTALEKGFKRENVITFPDQPSGVKMLVDGRIDMIALADFGIQKMKEMSGSNTLQVVFPVTDLPRFCAAAAFKKEDTALRDAYNAGLKKLRASGEFDKILISYGMGPRLPLIAAAPTTAKFCEKQ